ncbi:MAG: carboxypeptidase-like regulatory domain-containing protein [Chloroflexi bacterium]|nr:carboxypeptidase-like regulatory domain-containing protein [Chloroflexota bacterium]
MNKKLKIFICALLFVVLGAAVFAAAGFDVLWNGEKIPARIIDKNGELFISLNDLSEKFPGTVTIDYKKRQVSFDVPGKVDLSKDINNKISNAEKTKQGLVWGFVSLKKGDFILPLRDIKVSAHPGRSDLPGELKSSLFDKKLADKKNSEYDDTMGVVRSCTADSSGRYILYPLPEGEYEITAVINGWNKSAGWRIPVGLKSGEVLRLDLDYGNITLKDKI